MATNKPEVAVNRLRAFPSTYERLRKRLLSGKTGTRFPEVLDDIERKATLWEKFVKEQGKK